MNIYERSEFFIYAGGEYNFKVRRPVESDIIRDVISVIESRKAPYTIKEYCRDLWVGLSYNARLPRRRE